MKTTVKKKNDTKNNSKWLKKVESQDLIKFGLIPEFVEGDYF